MIVSDLNIVSKDGLTRVTASVQWENCGREPQQVFVETLTDTSQGMWANPDAFLSACYLPAWREGERRVRIEGAICPQLTLNLSVVSSQIASWYAEEFTTPPPAIESTEGLVALKPMGHEAVCLFTGGADSLSMVRWNALNLPADHPGRITAAINVFFRKEQGTSASEFRGSIDKLVSLTRPALQDLRITLIPVSTNAWWLVNDGYFFDLKWHGGLFAAIASLFSHGYAMTYIASGWHLTQQQPYGSHPQIDPYYSSASVRVEHHNVGLRRIDKVALIADWQEGLRSLHVCQNNNWDPNCGRCEKCVRTMTALESLGKLKDCPAFPLTRMTLERLDATFEYLLSVDKHAMDFYKELVRPLRRQGRDDLADLITEGAIAASVGAS